MNTLTTHNKPHFIHDEDWKAHKDEAVSIYSYSVNFAEYQFGGFSQPTPNKTSFIAISEDVKQSHKTILNRFLIEFIKDLWITNFYEFKLNTSDFTHKEIILDLGAHKVIFRRVTGTLIINFIMTNKPLKKRSLLNSKIKKLRAKRMRILKKHLNENVLYFESFERLLKEIQESENFEILSVIIEEQRLIEGK